MTVLYRLHQYLHWRGKRRKDSRWRVAPMLDVVLRYVDPATAGRVLDLGPRNDYEVRCVIAAGFRQVDALDLCAQTDLIRRGDMQAMPYEDSRFDLVIASHVFEHAHSQRRAAQEIARVVRPWGLVWIAVPKGAVPNVHDRWRFERVEDVIRPFREAGVAPFVEWEGSRSSEVRVLLTLSKPAAARRILVALSDARMVRDWVGSGLVGMLCDREHGVVVLVPATLAEKVRQQALPFATVEPWEPHRGPRWVRWVLRWPIRTLSYAIRARWSGPAGEAYRHKLALRRPKRQRLGAAVAAIVARLISRWCVADKGGDRALRGAARVLTFLGQSRAANRLLDDLRPDVVVAPTMLHEGTEIPLLSAAKRRGIKVVVAVGSLDTLVSKGTLLVKPDRLLVWGKEQRDAAQTAHGFGADVLGQDIVEVTGPPQFDVYGTVDPGDPKPEVYVVGSSLQYWADGESVRLMLEAAQDDLGVTIAFSPHPRRSGETWDWTGPEMAERLRRSLCLVSAWSTLAVEAALCGRPTLFVAYGQGVPRFGQWPHMQPILDWPDVRICRSPEELLQGIRDLVSGAWVPDRPMLRWGALMQARADGNARERIVKVIEEVSATTARGRTLGP